MPVPMTCPHCRAKLNVPDQARGKRIRCKVCSEPISVPLEEVEEVLDARDTHIQANAEPNPRRQRSASASRRDEDRISDRPRGRRNSPEPKPSGSSTALIVGGAVAALLLILGGAGAIWFFTSRGSSSTPAPVAANDQAAANGAGANNNGGNAAGNPQPVGMGAGPAAAALPPLRYRWQGTPAVYAVTVALEEGNDYDLQLGHCTVHARPAGRAQAQAAPRKGTGTGFVVNPNGYLLTCAHVVEDATRIDVTIGGRVFPGTVQAIDHDHDLALVQIQANGLPTVPLANSDTAELGMEVWTVGFPLSTELGDNIKTTKGTLSGINRKNDRKVLQVDAPINPGNSGGPLFSAGGGVLGVNKAKLAGEAVSNIGFATPSNEAMRMLQGKGVTFTTAQPGAKLDGPTLIRQVTPAVALITVTIGPAAASETYHLTCATSLAKSKQPRQPGVPLNPTIPLTFGGQAGTLQVDANGNLTQPPQNDVQLPAILGGVGRFLIEPLPTGGQPTWEKSANWLITESTPGFPFRRPGFPGRRGPRFGPRFMPGPPGFPGNQPERKQTAMERSSYTRGAANGDRVTIDKRFELKAEPVAGMAGFSLTGNKQIVFDNKVGLPTLLEFKGELVETAGNTTNRLPIQVRFKLLEGAERERILDPKVTDAEMPGVLADVTGADFARRNEAINRLRIMKPTVRRDEVARTLTGVVKDSKDVFLRITCLQALATWATNESVPVLLSCLDDANTQVRSGAIVPLGNLKVERAAEPIAKCLGNPFERGAASAALKNIGPKAEKFVLPWTENKDEWVQHEAVKILRVIGTKESKPALEKASKSKNVFIANDAKAALAEMARP